MNSRTKLTKKDLGAITRALKASKTQTGAKDSRKRAFAKGRSSGLRDDIIPTAPRGFVGTRGDAKYHDLAAATYAAGTTGNITHLSAIGQGTTVNTREGKAFRCTSVNVRGMAFNNVNPAVTIAAGYLVWDYSPQKAIAGITDILDAVTYPSFPKRENNERFKIVKKWIFSLTGDTSGSGITDTAQYEIDDYVKLPKDANVLCTTADTTGAIGATIQGALYFVSTGNTAEGGGTPINPSFRLAFRVNFTDKTT